MRLQGIHVAKRIGYFTSQLFFFWCGHMYTLMVIFVDKVDSFAQVDSYSLNVERYIYSNKYMRNDERNDTRKRRGEIHERSTEKTQR